jgi:hypothetical protein
MIEYFVAGFLAGLLFPLACAGISGLFGGEERTRG